MAKDILYSFCQNISDDITNRISQPTEDSEGVVLLNTYNEKCKTILATIKGKEEKDLKENICKVLKDVSQLILDVTYVKEIQLVEDDFSHEAAESDIQSIIDSLTSLETLAKSVCPQDEITISLGSEIVECLRWRKGALLYMFCHTMHHKSPDEGISSPHIHYLEGGVKYLMSMLKTRCDVKWMESCPEGGNDENDTLKLIEQGIFSDTHLLALMYCGEMCYWHALSTGLTKTDDETTHKGKSTESSISDNITKLSAKNKSNNKDANLIGDAKSKCENSTESKTSSKSSSATLSDKTGNKDTSNSQKDQTDQKASGSSSMVSIGSSCLKKYLSVTKGPLAGAGWSTDRAQDIVLCFEKLEL